MGAVNLTPTKLRSAVEKDRLTGSGDPGA